MAFRCLLLLSLYSFTSSFPHCLATQAFSPLAGISFGSFRSPQLPPSLTLVRGGATTMKSTAATTSSDNDEDDKMQKDIQSMKFCYRAALFSTAVDIYENVIVQGKQPLQELFTSFHGTLDILSSLHILGFGIGIYQICRLYQKNPSTSSSADLSKLTSTLRMVWFNAWTILTMGTMAHSTSLCGSKEKLLGNNYYAGPATVVAIALTSASFLTNRHNMRVKEYQDTTTLKPTNKDDNLTNARKNGLVAARNMEFCMASFAMDALVRGAVTLTKGDTLLNTCIGMLDVMEPAVVFLLLKSMLSAFRPALMRVTDPKTRKSGRGYSELYDAETGFYTKIGKVLFFPALTKVVSPYLIHYTM